MKTFAIIALASVLLVPPALAERTDPGPRTTGEAINEGIITGLGGSTNNQAYRRGYEDGSGAVARHERNEGFLYGYGAATGLTPGPVEVPIGAGGAGKCSIQFDLCHVY